MEDLFEKIPFLYHSGINITDIVIRIFYSGLVGLAIGYNRQIRYQSAGLRTFSLITLGSTIAMLISFYVPFCSGVGDPSRIAAQVLSGVGFLGAGAIIRGRGDHVQGLTTAACIWVCAALGLAIGAGMYISSFVVFCLVLIILQTLVKVSNRMGLRREMVSIILYYSVSIPDIPSLKEALKKENLKITSVSTDSQLVENKSVVTVRGFLYKEQSNAESIHASLSQLNSVTNIKSYL